MDGQRKKKRKVTQREWELIKLLRVTKERMLALCDVQSEFQAAEMCGGDITDDIRIREYGLQKLIEDGMTVFMRYTKALTEPLDLEAFLKDLHPFALHVPVDLDIPPEVEEDAIPF